MRMILIYNNNPDSVYSTQCPVYNILRVTIIIGVHSLHSIVGTYVYLLLSLPCPPPKG